MKSKLEQIRSEGYKTLGAIFIIGVAVYLGFTPLFDKVNGGVAGAVLGASFGAIFVIVLTMYLLNKQTEIEQESKKGERVFAEKVVLYWKIIEETEKMLEDGQLSKEKEMRKIPFVMTRLLMMGNDDVIQKYKVIFTNIYKIFESKESDTVDIEDQSRTEIMDALSHFAVSCRVDLGVSGLELDKTLFEDIKKDLQKMEGIRRGKAKGWMTIEEFLQACKEKERPPELIESTRKLHDKLMQHYRSEPGVLIEIPDFSKSQSQAKLKERTGKKGIFCDITLQKKGIRIGGICKSSRWDYKQLKFPELFFKHDMEHTRKLKIDGITQIDERELKEILFVLDESKKVLEEGKGLKNYKKAAKEGDEKASKQLEELMAEDYTLELNLDNE